MLLIIKWAIAYSIIAIVYKEILSREKILNWWFVFGLKYEKRLIYRPIWGCEKCFAGQLAFWVFVINWILSNFDEKGLFVKSIFYFVPKYGNMNYSVIMGLFSVTLTIFITYIISKTIKKLNYE